MKAKKKGKSKDRESRTQAPYGPAVGEVLQALDALRRNRDGIAEAGDGFTIRDDGFFGTIYYRLGPRVLESAFEYWDPGIREIVVDLGGLRQWILPVIEPVSEEDRRRDAFIRMIRNQGGRPIFSPFIHSGFSIAGTYGAENV